MSSLHKAREEVSVFQPGEVAALQCRQVKGHTRQYSKSPHNILSPREPYSHRSLVNSQLLRGNSPPEKHKHHQCSIPSNMDLFSMQKTSRGIEQHPTLRTSLSKNLHIFTQTTGSSTPLTPLATTPKFD